MNNYLAQPTRLALMLLEMAMFWLIFSLVVGSWAIPLGAKSFYFYTGLLGLILGSRITTPFFQRPADVIAYAIPALVAVLLAPLSESKASFAVSLQHGLLIFYIAILAFAFLAIAFKDSGRTYLRLMSAFFRTIANRAGKPNAIYGPLIFFALYLFHYGDPKEFLLLAVAALIFVILSPIESALVAYKSIATSNSFSAPERGEIAGLQMPGILLVRSAGTVPRYGQVLDANDPYCPSGKVIAMDLVGRDDGLLIRTLVVPSGAGDNSTAGSLPLGSVGLTPSVHLDEVVQADRIEHLCGLVAVDSNVSTLQFEVTKPKGLEVGSLLAVQLNGEDVFYQVVDGVTKEDVVQQKNTFGYVKASAKQVGIWQPDVSGFRPCRWVPSLNSPVFIEPAANPQQPRGAIGYFPSSSYPIRIANADSLVTHNCAILGVLGVGKSSLAFVLIEKLIEHGVKILALDITGEYREELNEHLSAEQDRFDARITDAAAHGAEDWNEAPGLGGSLAAFKASIRDEIASFMSPANPETILIVDPMRLHVTKQLSEPKNVNLGKDANGRDIWQRVAQLYPLTPVEITRIVSEAALDVLSDRFSTTARLCLVYEEAHSLVPEWTSIVAEGDKAATSGTARAILQGRKYGLGCMVISQRTANVTKTILNQCSTIFAMRSFDDTSKDFLSNYIGAGFARVLPELSDRQAVVFGRASSCVNPVLMQVIERQRRARNEQPVEE
jgi:hypothetical protein